MFDINDYFQRIDFTGTPQADLATLKALQALHPASIPFENIDVLLPVQPEWQARLSQLFEHSLSDRPLDGTGKAG